MDWRSSLAVQKRLRRLDRRPSTVDSLSELLGGPDRRTAVRGALKRGHRPRERSEGFLLGGGEILRAPRPPPTAPRWRARRQGRRIPATRSSRAFWFPTRRIHSPARAGRTRDEHYRPGVDVRHRLTSRTRSRRSDPYPRRPPSAGRPKPRRPRSTPGHTLRLRRASARCRINSQNPCVVVASAILRRPRLMPSASSTLSRPMPRQGVHLRLCIRDQLRLRACIALLRVVKPWGVVSERAFETPAR